MEKEPLLPAQLPFSLQNTEGEKEDERKGVSLYSSQACFLSAVFLSGKKTP